MLHLFALFRQIFLTHFPDSVFFKDFFSFFLRWDLGKLKKTEYPCFFIRNLSQTLKIWCIYLYMYSLNCPNVGTKNPKWPIFWKIRLTKMEGKPPQNDMSNGF